MMYGGLLRQEAGSGIRREYEYFGGIVLYGSSRRIVVTLDYYGGVIWMLRGWQGMSTRLCDCRTDRSRDV